MNTGDLLLEAVELLKVGNEVDAAVRVEIAHDVDSDNSFETISDKLYTNLLANNQEVAGKFKNLCASYLSSEPGEEVQELESEVISNTAVDMGSNTIKWIVIGLIVILAIYLLGAILA